MNKNLDQLKKELEVKKAEFEKLQKEVNAISMSEKKYAKKTSTAMNNILAVEAFIIANKDSDIPLKQSVKYNEICPTIVAIESFLKKYPSNEDIQNRYNIIKNYLNKMQNGQKPDINVFKNSSVAIENTNSHEHHFSSGWGVVILIKIVFLIISLGIWLH